MRTLFFICRVKEKHPQTSVQKGCRKTATNTLTVRSTLQKIDSTSIQIEPKSMFFYQHRLKVSRNGFGKKVNSRNAKRLHHKGEGRCMLRLFWPHLADFGGHFDLNWIRRGPTIVTLGHHPGKMMRKKGLPKRDQTNHDFF